MCLYQEGRAAKWFDWAQIHLACEDGLSGTLLIQAWRDTSRRMSAAAKKTGANQFNDLAIKLLGDGAQWGCTDLDASAQVANSKTMKELVSPLRDLVPKSVAHVVMEDLPRFRGTPYLINIVAVLVSADGGRTNQQS